MKKYSFKTQIALIALFVYNWLYNHIPFFVFKKYLLMVYGSKIGKNSFIHTPVKLFSFRPLTIGNNSTINPRCYIDTRKGITIGNNVNIAHDTKIYTLGHDVNTVELSSVGDAVIIEDDVFIFSNVVIMPGVHIGKGAVIYPCSVVANNVEPYTIVGGNPAKFIKKRENIIINEQWYGYWFAL
jgi:acetyltransferase-like isoleucine patch superfamily enzyme